MILLPRHEANKNEVWVLIVLLKLELCKRTSMDAHISVTKAQIFMLLYMVSNISESMKVGLLISSSPNFSIYIPMIASVTMLQNGLFKWGQGLLLFIAKKTRLMMNKEKELPC